MAFWTSPVLASLDSVVETVGRASWALVATWLAVIGSPPASAASTDAFVVARLVRRLAVGIGSPVRRSLAVRVARAAGLVLAARAGGRARAARTGLVGVLAEEEEEEEEEARCQPWPSRLT